MKRWGEHRFELQYKNGGIDFRVQRELNQMRSCVRIDISCFHQRQYSERIIEDGISVVC